jgi:hypothetical protein
MNCQDFLPELETGGPWRRIRARRHAARCPRCAAVYSAFRAAKHRLAAAEPLPPHARELWNRATRGIVVLTEHRYRWTPAVACLATAACLLLVFVGPALWLKHVERVNVTIDAPREKTIVSPTSVIELDPSVEFTQLADAAVQLDAELQSLRMTAQRLEARREVMIALIQYGEW